MAQAVAAHNGQPCPNSEINDTSGNKKRKVSEALKKLGLK